ncbi:MAG: tandem-95 repeat protein, partial [Alphaproteobacteria bacterium]|nr:tandem-95 repeat protein [Alphaproteobacteria bacterium]
MVMAQGEPPVVTGVATDAAYREGGAPVILSDALILSDADGTFLEGATVRITAGLVAGDRLTVGGAEEGGSLTFDFAGRGYLIGWQYDLRTATLTFEGHAPLAAYQDLLRQVGFSSGSDNPGATRTIDWTVNDGRYDSLSRTTHIAVTEINDHPVLVDLAPSLTVAEHDAPHLLDANVNFTDSEGNFDGGSLRLSGLLAEDRIAVRDQGAAPGRIGVSGSDISYGGTIIGSLSGGAGTTLVVTFNGAASAAAVDALIQNLTYATAGAAPTASRTLLLNVFDAAGADLGPVPGPTTYAGPAGATDPFHGLDVGLEASPAFVDLDNDGKLDLVVGNAAGKLHSFHNNGDGSFTELVGAANPFQAVNLLSFAAPAFADIDGDGDLDAVIGSAEYPLRTFRNDHGVFTELSGADNPFPGLVGFSGHVTFVDLDNDGDPDALSVDLSGFPVALRNDGGIFTEVPGNLLNGAMLSFDDRTNLVDMDGDGDLDLVVGNDAGHLQLYRNDGGVFTEVKGAADPFRDLDFGADAVPAFADLAGDGNLDVVVGASDGTLHWLDNITPRGAAITVDVIAVNDPPTLTGFAANATFLENEVNAAPVLLDADVTFGDPEGNVGGGALTVSGLLSEDHVAIRNQGDGTGEIGVFSSDVLYGGTVI